LRMWNLGMMEPPGSALQSRLHGYLCRILRTAACRALTPSVRSERFHSIPHEQIRLR
jgi:hypothetical protein